MASLEGKRYARFFLDKFNYLSTYVILYSSSPPIGVANISSFVIIHHLHHQLRLEGLLVTPFVLGRDTLSLFR